MGSAQLTIEALPGEQAKVIPTSVLFHPAALGLGETVAMIVGGPDPAIVKFVQAFNPLN
jgi:hypothetical protein